jgi:hypothetical protein
MQTVASKIGAPQALTRPVAILCHEIPALISAGLAAGLFARHAA